MLIRLTSSPMIFTPGVVNFAKRVFASGDVAGAMGLMGAAFPSLAFHVARGLVDGSIETTIDGDRVTFDALLVDVSPGGVCDRCEGPLPNRRYCEHSREHLEREGSRATELVRVIDEMKREQMTANIALADAAEKEDHS